MIETVPGGLACYLPSLRYLLINEGAIAEQDLPADPNLVAALVRLENSGLTEDVARVVRLLVRWLGNPEQASLRRALTVWLAQVFLSGRLPGVELHAINDLHEIDTMLAERVKEWIRTWKQQGLEEGLRRGSRRGWRMGGRREKRPFCCA